MPVVVMHGGGGNSAISSKTTGPKSHLCISIVATVLNPIFGPLALFFSCWSRQRAAMDWEGARTKGRLALWISVAAIVISAIAALVFVLIRFTRDT